MPDGSEDRLLRFCWATGRPPAQTSSWATGQHCSNKPTTDIGLCDECHEELTGARAAFKEKLRSINFGRVPGGAR